MAADGAWRGIWRFRALGSFRVRSRLNIIQMGLRNFIVDKKGGLWLIDWAYAGAFPAWLEYAQLAAWGDAAREDRRPPKLWIWFASLMIGNYRRYKITYLDKMDWAWCRPSWDFYDLDYFDKLGLAID